MAKVEISRQSWGYKVRFHCPGCDGGHAFDVREDGLHDAEHPSWTFNGDLERPTCTPSLLYPDKTPRCHLHMRDGRLEFLGDCGHALAGSTVDMPDVEEG